MMKNENSLLNVTLVVVPVVTAVLALVLLVALDKLPKRGFTPVVGLLLSVKPKLDFDDPKLKPDNGFDGLLPGFPNTKFDSAAFVSGLSFRTSGVAAVDPNEKVGFFSSSFGFTVSAFGFSFSSLFVSTDNFGVSASLSVFEITGVPNEKLVVTFAGDSVAAAFIGRPNVKLLVVSGLFVVDRKFVAIGVVAGLSPLLIPNLNVMLDAGISQLNFSFELVASTVFGSSGSVSFSAPDDDDSTNIKKS